MGSVREHFKRDICDYVASFMFGILRQIFSFSENKNIENKLFSPQNNFPIWESVQENKLDQ